MVALGVLGLAACGGEGGGPAPEAAPAPDEETPGGVPGKADDLSGDPDEALPRYHVCEDAPTPTGLPEVEWEHFSSGVVALGSPWHSAQDVVVGSGEPASVAGKFTYGSVSKDLEGERIEVWVDVCEGAYVRVGEGVTDSDGRVTVEVPTSLLPGVGRFGVYLRVMGDNSAARSTLRVLPAETRLVVFDIDGTLTTDDLELFEDVIAEFFEPLLGGDYVPEARAGAEEAAWLRSMQGYEVIYLTGRPYWLTGLTREWLAALGFPPGSLHVADSHGEILPTEGSVGAYKTAYLRELQGSGLVVDGAYGNATTDIYAYGQVGVELERTWILGKHGGEDGTQGLGEGYVEHLEGAQAEAWPAQPFTR